MDGDGDDGAHRGRSRPKVSRTTLPSAGRLDLLTSPMAAGCHDSVQHPAGSAAPCEQPATHQDVSVSGWRPHSLCAAGVREPLLPRNGRFQGSEEARGEQCGNCDAEGECCNVLGPFACYTPTPAPGSPFSDDDSDGSSRSQRERSPSPAYMNHGLDGGRSRDRAGVTSAIRTRPKCHPKARQAALSDDDSEGERARSARGARPSSWREKQALDGESLAPPQLEYATRVLGRGSGAICDGESGDGKTPQRAKLSAQKRLARPWWWALGPGGTSSAKQAGAALEEYETGEPVVPPADPCNQIGVWHLA